MITQQKNLNTGEWFCKCPKCGDVVNLGDYFVDGLMKSYVITKCKTCYNQSMEERIHKPYFRFDRDPKEFTPSPMKNTVILN